MTPASIIASENGLSESSVSATIALLKEGATIPFISRYRKEVTGSLDEVTIFNISRRLKQLEELATRKEHILSVISEQGKLTQDLKAKIEQTIDPAVLEDIYMPFKPRRRTKAQIAREHGLEPLAKIIMAQSSSCHAAAERFINNEITDSDTAIAGASDIIAEWISEHTAARDTVRRTFFSNAVIRTSVVKGHEEEAENYRNYIGFEAPLRHCSSHQVLAIMRAAKEGVMKYTLSVDDEQIIGRISRFFIRQASVKESAKIISDAVKDSYRRLIRPSIETEIMAAAKERADTSAIGTFTSNLRQLLLAPPLGNKRVLAIDPGFRTGCKVACLGADGSLLHHDVIYPTAPKNDTRGAAKKISYLVEAYKIDAISLGNGTASRETERFLKSISYPRKVQIFVVNESGASVYSASKIARDEFPDKDVTVRGTVSIGRRLIDPLAELVKIEPKSIGVGQYQHDVDQKRLKESLDMTVEACVNSVGVNLNTASASLLSYVSGIGETMAANIVSYRNANGRFYCRQDLMKVPRFGAKAFQQSAGFLRIPESENPLDNTAVHPECYDIVDAMARDMGIPLKQLVREPDKVSSIDLNRYVTDTVGIPTLKDIVTELEKPGRDPRSGIKVFEFDENVKDIADLRPGMILPGIVNNITQFGAFVDIGIHQSGLIHLSQMTERFISSPDEVVKLNDHVRVKVLDIDLQRKRISLSMKNVDQ